MPNFIRIAILLLLAAPALAERPIEFGVFAWPENGSIVVPVAAAEQLTGLAAALDERTDGAISRATAEALFTGEKNQALTLFGIRPYARIDLVGVGGEPLTRVAAENFGGLAAMVLHARRS